MYIDLLSNPFAVPWGSFGTFWDAVGILLCLVGAASGWRSLGRLGARGLSLAPFGPPCGTLWSLS
jgi:hypothetical protein